jgi:hypothetical protein
MSATYVPERPAEDPEADEIDRSFPRYNTYRIKTPEGRTVALVFADRVEMGKPDAPAYFWLGRELVASVFSDALVFTFDGLEIRRLPDSAPFKSITEDLYA